MIAISYTDNRYSPDTIWTYRPINDTTIPWNDYPYPRDGRKKPWVYLSKYQTTKMPWLFDYDKPWRAPVHYPPAPRTIVSDSATIRKILTIYKQPTSRSGFRRGQRR